MTDPIELHLSDRLVLKHFGQRPWLGRRLRLHTMRSTAGVKWKQKRFMAKNGNWIPIGEPYIVKNELTVDAMIALRPVQGKRGLWRVYVNDQWHDQALSWLEANCGELAAVKAPRHYTKRAAREKVSQWSKMPERVDNG